MTDRFASRALALGITLTAASAAIAHVSLPPGGAAAGSEYAAAFKVGHACKDAASTTGITVRLPRGFELLEAQPRPGWTLDVQKTGDGEVRWSADSAAAALPNRERAEFVVRGRLTATPGPLYFKVLQRCDVGSTDWAALPNGTAGQADAANPAYPAARLDVLAPGVAAVAVSGAWIRPSVPGQSGTGAFMTLSAPAGARLVGISTPAAGVAEVHEMKMEGDTMRMRAVPGGLALPAGRSVELKPGGYHVMLMDLKRALPKGAAVPLTLRFEDAKGVAGTLAIEVPVGAPADDAAAASATSTQHRH